ncbi:MAG TPA: nitroreductase family protein [Xanthobacteraceae bacterium]|jgi:nitroreductase/FMN reductase [NAD(P)H]
MSGHTEAKVLQQMLAERFGESLSVDPSLPGLSELAGIAGHRSHRRYLDRAVAPELLRLLCACALSAPSKSDLQQSDIVVVGDGTLRSTIAAAIPDMPWIEQAPVFLVFLANGRRLPRLAQMRGKPFPNDHLDLFFNAVVDCAIVLATFLRAAAAVGLGACPISAIRDHAALLSTLLQLPDRVIPVAGLCLGWPAAEGRITPRLGLGATVHHDRHEDASLAAEIDRYDRRRAAARPYAGQRDPQRWGNAPFYGWSEDKARQYAEPLRADFGAFVRGKGFRLE